MKQGEVMQMNEIAIKREAAPALSMGAEAIFYLNPQNAINHINGKTLERTGLLYEQQR